MAFVVTARHVGTSATSAVQTQATDSQTPTASSLLLVASSGENAGSNAAAHSWTVSGGSLSYTQIAKSADSPWGAGDNRLSGVVHRAPIGASPSAFAVTSDAYAGTETGYYYVHACDITGHDVASPVVQSKANGGTINPANSGPHNVSVTLDAAAAVGNLIVVSVMAGADSGTGISSPLAGSGKTFTTVSNPGNAYVQIGTFSRVADGTEDLAITVADLGNAVGNWGAVAVEIKADAGGPPPSLMFLSPIRSGL